ncbi:MAG: tetratricopeptide repeat protein [Candidatus Kuenenia sp.]|nr:tetratricopeptide repeat protein [Candidatus Kuenenia hertensis]
MMRTRFCVFIFAVLFLCAGKLFGYSLSKDEVVKTFATANENHLEAVKFIAEKNLQEANKKLEEAALQYEMIISKGFRNGRVYYNLGNTYYRLGEVGKAILNYRKAQRLMPRNAELDANLRLAKNSIEDKEVYHETPAVIQRVLFWFFLMNQNEIITLSVSLYIIVMVLFIALIILKYQWLKRVIIGFSVGLLIAVVSLGIKIYVEQGTDRGVIITKKCPVRYGPGEEYETKYEIHEGVECIVEQVKGKWYKVYVHVGIKQEDALQSDTDKKEDKEIRRGWLHKDNLGVI